MSLFKSISVPDSNLVVRFTDDDASPAKVFVTLSDNAYWYGQKPFSEFSEALAKGVIGSRITEGTYRPTGNEIAFLETLRADVARYTDAMNIAVHQRPDHPDAAAAREVLRAFGNALDVFDRPGRESTAPSP